MVADKEAELSKLEKSKAKGGKTISEKIAAENARQAAIEQARASLAQWRKIQQQAQQPQATTTEQPAAEQTLAEQATEQPSVEQQSTNEQQVEQTQAAIAQEEQKPSIPKDEKGNTLYHQVPVETTINDLYDGKLDDNEIRDFVDANISEADKNLEKVSKKAPKIGTNKDEYLKKKQEWQKQVEDATRIRDYWNSVKDYIAQQTHTTPEEVKAAQDELSGEAARREYQDMGENIQQDPISVANDTTGEEQADDRGNQVLPEQQVTEQRGNGSGTEPGTEVQAGVQGTDENAVAPEEAQERIIQPVGTNRFGNIYNWAKGQFQSAALFLNNLKSGYLRSVFYRDGIGDIDMVWGNDKAGLQHIIKKHIEEADDFSSVEEAMQIINDTISNGNITRQGSNISLDNNGYRVSIAQSDEGNWVLTAFDKTRSRAEKKRNKGNATIGDQSVSDMENGTLASPQLVSSESKDSEKSTITSSLDEKIVEEGNKVNTNPTEGQKEAGNYKKGHVRIDGYDITIEQPKGSVRRGTDADGKQWEQTMNNTYGYICGTEGVDGDHIDIFLSENPTEGNVYVVDQVNSDGSFDEHKVMYGFQSAEEARAAYLSNYEEGWKGLGTITEVSKDEFKKWVNSSKRKTKPFSEYKSVNAIGAQNEERNVADGMNASKVNDKENITRSRKQDGGFPLTETEYADRRMKELMKENMQLDEDDAENMALDEYPSYIGEMIKNGELETLYTKSSINDKIKLGRIVESAGDVCYYAKIRILKQIIDLMINIVCHKRSATPQWERAADSNSSDVHAAAVGVTARRMCLYGLH